MKPNLLKAAIPNRIKFILLGVLSTIWFLVRVIPKPSRATYPCMRVAAPFMSALVIYLLSIGGIAAAFRKTRQYLKKSRYIAAAGSLVVMVFMIAFSLSSDRREAGATPVWETGPDDGPNQPMGTAVGIHQGRVLWAWDPDATDENAKGYFFNPKYVDQEVIGNMFSKSVKKLAGESTVEESWDALFRDFNLRKHGIDKGYAPGEKIFIKINQTTGRGKIRTKEREKGNYDVLSNASLDGPPSRTCETTPYLVLELLRHLVNQCGIEQSDIAIGDPQNPTLGHNYDAWSTEFPEVIYTDRMYGTHGRTLIKPTSEDLLFYADKIYTDKLFDVIEEADYMINMANFKPHSRAGITLTAKNHFGSQSRQSANHLHYSLVCPLVFGSPGNGGYQKFRVQVDLMGSKYLGRNTLLFIVDGLFAGGSGEGGPPVKYFMAPFHGDWCNSIFMSQDQVALESVCYDFLRTEWNGIHKHSSTNNQYESLASVKGVDDYLHQAALASNWPEGIVYDPDNSGNPLPSLGVHEHWNDPGSKQYSRNLGKPDGIELVSIPSRLVGDRAARKSIRKQKKMEAPPVVEEIKSQPMVEDHLTESRESGFISVEMMSFRKDFAPKVYYSGFIDDDDVKWFLTDLGIVSGRFGFFDTVFSTPVIGLEQFTLQNSSDGPKVWFATSRGAMTANMPYRPDTTVKIYDTDNSSIADDSVIGIAVGSEDLVWFGSKNGISGLFKEKWLHPSYQDIYPEELFDYFPITSIAVDHGVDTVLVATRGGGVGRFYRNDVDGITGASAYSKWGPCKLPSDNVHCIYVNGNTQWYGTDAGLAKHVGSEYMENWTAYTTEDGLVNNFVQTVAIDASEKVWVGTSGGISVLDESGWTSYTSRDGLLSNNILCILCDRVGNVFLGTDNGFMIYKNGNLICFQQ